MAKNTDFLLTIDVNTVYLENASNALEIIVDNLYRELIAYKKFDPAAPLESMECHCTAIYTILRDLRRTQAAMDSAVQECYQAERENAVRMGGE